MSEAQEEKGGDSSGLVTPSGRPVETVAEKPEGLPEMKKGKAVANAKLVVVETGTYEYLGQFDTIMYCDPFGELDGRLVAPFILRRAFRMSKAQDQRTGQIITIPFGPFDLYIANPNFVMRDATGGEKEAHMGWLLESAGLAVSKSMPPQLDPGLAKCRR